MPRSIYAAAGFDCHSNDSSFRRAQETGSSGKGNDGGNLRQQYDAETKSSGVHSHALSGWDDETRPVNVAVTWLNKSWAVNAFGPGVTGFSAVTISRRTP